MRNKKVHIIIIVIFIAIISISFYYILDKPINLGLFNKPINLGLLKESINLGLDLKGGTQIILKPTEKDGEEVTTQKLDKAMGIVRDRIDRLGISEPLVTKDLLSNNIIVQLPGVKDPDTAKEIIGKTAELEFRLVKGTFIFIKDQSWDIVKFDPKKSDPEKGQLIINPQADRVVLIEDINALINSGTVNIIAELVTDPETGELVLVEPASGANEENSDMEDSSKINSDINIDPEKIIGKIIYDPDTRELLLVSGENEEETGEILVDSRSSAATLVGPVLVTEINWQKL